MNPNGHPYSALPDLTGGECLKPDTNRTDFHPEGAGHKAAEERALAACNRCTVRDKCLTDALTYENAVGASWGIWGGLNERDRRALRRHQAKEETRVA